MQPLRGKGELRGKAQEDCLPGKDRLEDRETHGRQSSPFAERPRIHGYAPIRGSGKEASDCWDNRRTPNRRSMPSDSENGLRVDGDRVFFAGTDRVGLPGCLLPPGEVDAQEDDGAAEDLVRREALPE